MPAYRPANRRAHATELFVGLLGFGVVAAAALFAATLAVSRSHSEDAWALLVVCLLGLVIIAIGSLVAVTGAAISFASWCWRIRSNDRVLQLRTKLGAALVGALGALGASGVVVVAMVGERPGVGGAGAALFCVAAVTWMRNMRCIAERQAAVARRRMTDVALGAVIGHTPERPLRGEPASVTSAHGAAF